MIDPLRTRTDAVEVLELAMEIALEVFGTVASERVALAVRAIEIVMPDIAREAERGPGRRVR